MTRNCSAAAMHRGIYSLARAELGAVTMFENGNDLSYEMIDLALGQRGLATLESGANKQGVFSGRNIFPAEEIDGLDGNDFRDVERADRFENLGKGNSVREQQREIALHRRETRKRLVAARGL